MAGTARVLGRIQRDGIPLNFRSAPGSGQKIVMRLVPLIVLLLCGLGLAWWGVLSRPLSESKASSTNEPASRTFTVFDGTLYKQKPDFRQYGIASILMIYEYRFWPNGDITTALPDQRIARALATEAGSSIAPVVIDIERWPVRGSPSLVQSSVTKYRTILQWFHEVAPDLRLGYYGTIPVPDYWRANQAATSPEFKAWQQDNDQLELITNDANVLFPSLYTFYADRQGWVTY